MARSFLPELHVILAEVVNHLTSRWRSHRRWMIDCLWFYFAKLWQTRSHSAGELNPEAGQHSLERVKGSATSHTTAVLVKIFCL